MKLFCCLLLFLLSYAGISFARKQEHKIPRQIFTTAEQMPEFPGGKEALNRFLAKHLKYPKNACKNKIEGRVVARFVVETDGRISNVEIEHSVDADCDKETLRVIAKMPKWNPGRQHGVAAAIYYSLPVTFQLE